MLDPQLCKFDQDSDFCIALFNYHFGDFLGWKNDGIPTMEIHGPWAHGLVGFWDGIEISDTPRVSTWFSA